MHPPRAREIIVHMDMHAEYEGDFVRSCVRVLERTGADNVGGPARPRARTFFQRCVAAALTSPLGIGGRNTAGTASKAGSRACGRAHSDVRCSSGRTLRPARRHQRGRRAQPAHRRRGRTRIPQPRDRCRVLPARVDARARAPVLQVRAGQGADTPEASPLSLATPCSSVPLGPGRGRPHRHFSVAALRSVVARCVHARYWGGGRACRPARGPSRSPRRLGIFRSCTSLTARDSRPGWLTTHGSPIGRRPSGCPV